MAVTLLADVNCPGSLEDLVSNWEPAHSLVEDAVSGAEIAPCLLALAVACLPLYHQQGDGQVHSWVAPLWYLLNTLFCEQAGLCPRSELFTGKFSLSLFFLVGVLSYISSLRLSSECSGLVLTLSMQPTPPCSAPAHW